MAWASSDDRDDRKRGDGEIRRVAFLFCRFPPHHIDLLMLFCLRLHLLAFFLCCIASGVGRGTYTKKRAWLRGSAAQPLGYGNRACLLPWEPGEWMGLWLWRWLDEVVCLGAEDSRWGVGCGGGRGRGG